MSRAAIIPLPLPFADELKTLARERMADGMIVEAQLLAEAASHLRELQGIKAAGRRSELPFSDQMVDLPARLRERGGADRSMLLKAATQIEAIDLDILGLPAAPAQSAALSTLMRAYLMEGVHQGGDSTFAGLVKRGFITRPIWGAPLTDAGLRYVWAHCERALDKAFTSKQRRSLSILRSQAELKAALLQGALKNFRDYDAVVLPQAATRPVAILHPYLARAIRLGRPDVEYGSPPREAFVPIGAAA